jgi:protein-disulfide isomerase
VDKITSANPQIKVVLRQLPILSPDSVEAAKMALAAADQGKYGAFHKAMYAAERPDAAGIEAAAKAVGLDIARARAFAARPDVQAEVEQNLELARKLGISGTPSWIVGDQLLSGAVGYDELAKAVAAYKG